MTTKIPEALAVLDRIIGTYFDDDNVGQDDRDMRKARAAFSAQHDALKWFVENDDTNLDQEGNEYLAQGFYRGEAALAAVEHLK